MKALKYSRGELLRIIRTNRTAHDHTFAKAMAGYRRAVAEWHADELGELPDLALQPGTSVDVLLETRFSGTAPSSSLEEYDRVIRMLEITSEVTIELTVQEFAQYVMDEWTWSNEFLRSTSVYLAEAE